MTDTELRFARDELTSAGLTTEQMIGIVDEALRRGERLSQLEEEITRLAAIVDAARTANYGECVTLPDGECIGNGCIHDPQWQRIARLEAALRFYAEPMTYKAGAGCEYWLTPIKEDKGAKARAALEETP